MAKRYWPVQYRPEIPHSALADAKAEYQRRLLEIAAAADAGASAETVFAAAAEASRIFYAAYCRR